MKIVVYIDMDAFFASCHQVKKRTLQTKPIVVSGNSRRAIVSSASYEARKFGIKAAMPLFQARALCPQLIQVPVEKYLYDYYSDQILYLLRKNFNGNTEKCSIDEFCIEITNIYRQYGSALKCGKKIQSLIYEEFNLTCSIGISYNKFLAKIASEMRKPGGIFVIKPSQLKKILGPLNINNIHGIGPKTVAKLKLIGVNTVEDFITTSYQGQLKQIMKKSYVTYGQYFTSKVVDDTHKITKRKSVGCDFTFEYNHIDSETIIKFLQKIVKIVSERAQKLAVVGNVIILGVKNENCKGENRQVQLRGYTNSYEIIYDYTLYLFHLFGKKEPVRAVRISLKNIIEQATILYPVKLGD